MNTSIAPTAHRFARVLLVLLATVIALTVLQAAPASAYTTRSSGSPGRVTGYVVQGSHYDTCPSPYYTCFTPWVVGTGPMVYRSPASRGTQLITAVYKLQRYDGSYWVDHSQRVHTRYLYAGYGRLRMPRVDFLPNSGGYFRVIIGVAWTNSADTASHGAKVLTYNQVGDYTCNTRFPCDARNGYVWLRSPGV